MKAFKRIVVSIAALLLSGCSPLQTHYSADPQADFSQFRSFSWYSDGFPESISGLFAGGAAQMDSAIRSTIQQQLTEKGLAYINSDSADIWINYQAIGKTSPGGMYRYSMSDMEQGYLRKQIRYSSSFDFNRRYTTFDEQGTLIVDIINSQNLQVVFPVLQEDPRVP